MGRRYVRLFFEELASSEGWKKLGPEAQAKALCDLLRSALEGKIPPLWKRVADLREVGVAPKALDSDSRYLPFRRHWEDSWRARKREAWIWDRRQGGGLRQCYTKAEGNLETFKARVEALFSKKDPWTQERISCVFLSARWNELGGGKPHIPKPSNACGRCGRAHVSVACPP